MPTPTAEVTEAIQTASDVPPKTFERNAYGLLKGESYVYNDDGTINWRKMIKPEFLAPNKQYFERFGKKTPDSIEGLEDKELIILLGGIKELASKRGFNHVCHTIVAPNADYVASTCSITWIPNYETGNREVTFCSVGDAHPFNTNGFGRKYLGAIAENRAFVRCVRNFLKINIVGQDEIDASDKGEEEVDASVAILDSTMKQFNVTLDKIKEVLKNDKFDGWEGVTKLEDIPKFKQFELIERIKKAGAKKAAAN